MPPAGGDGLAAQAPPLGRRARPGPAVLPPPLPRRPAPSREPGAGERKQASTVQRGGREAPGRATPSPASQTGRLSERARAPGPGPSSHETGPARPLPVVRAAREHRRQQLWRWPGPGPPRPQRADRGRGGGFGGGAAELGPRAGLRGRGRGRRRRGRNSPGPGHGPLSPLPREVLLPESAQHLRQGTWGELRETTPRGACFRQGLPASAGGGCPPGPSSVSVCLQELPRPVLPVPRASHVLSAESQRLPDGPSEAWRKGRCPAVARRGGSLCGGPDHFERPGPAWPGGVGARTRGQLRGPAQPAEHAALRVLWRRPGRVGLRPGPRLHHGRRLPLRGPLAGRRFGSQVDVGQGEGPVAQPAPGGQPHGRRPSELPGQSDGGWDRDAAHHGHSPASFRRRPCGAWPGPPA